MVPELGHFSLILALCLCVAISIMPLVGSYTRNSILMNSGRSLSVGLFVFSALAFATLSWAFYYDDFSVTYVASHSNTLLPYYYKLTAVWGGHEGSLLLWIFLLSVWLLAIAFLGKGLPDDFRARIVSIMGMTVLGMLMFTLFTSNPFERILPGAPSDGQDLNPLLQDIGFIIHPPLLYVGYSGTSVAFAFAIAALLSGKLDSAWARWSRPWVNVAWAFLTIGMGLGSWWAYYELGWGFWWGWDPTENNVLIPWLTATALVHSLAVTEKRGLFKNWTILLSICTFSLILLGTFPARSGILTSVHSFASDPDRGLFLLYYVAVVIAGSLLLFAIRAPQVGSLSSFKVNSRETFLLLNNILLAFMMFVIFLGTYFPLAADFFNWGKVSVGAAYFNKWWVIIMLPLVLCLGLSSVTQWKQTTPGLFKKYYLIPAAISLVLALSLPAIFADHYHWGAVITIFACMWVLLATMAGLWRQTRNADNLWAGLRQLRVGYYSMVIAHIGVGLLVLAMGLTYIYEDERKIVMLPNERVELFGYGWEFLGEEDRRGPNYSANHAKVNIYRGEKLIATLDTEKRQYFSGQPTTEAGITGNLWRDLYVSLGEAAVPASDGGWAITIYVKPFIKFLWIGIALIGLGGFMALVDKRYRAVRERVKASSKLGYQAG